MQYYTLNIKDKDYKCCLNARACVELEQKLGTNPLNIFIDLKDSKKLPSVSSIILILWASLQKYEHGMSIDKTYDLYDAFCDDGKTMLDLIPIVLEIIKISGFYNEQVEEQKN